MTRDPGVKDANKQPQCRFLDSGGVYKLAFGPKAFIVVSDPVVVRHLLKVRARVSKQSLHAQLQVKQGNQQHVCACRRMPSTMTKEFWPRF